MKPLIPVLALLIGIPAVAAPDPLTGQPRWHRTFTPLTFGDQTGPNPDHDFAGGRGSMNLAFAPGHVAVVAADLPEPAPAYHLTVLQTDTGATRSSQPIRSNIGTSRSYLFPWSIVSASGENIPGLVRIHWDADSGILFTAQGAYESAYTAYRPLAPDAATGQPASPAYADLARHPGLRDAAGRTAAELWTTLSTAPNPTLGKDADIWGPSASYFGPDYNPATVTKKTRYDLDWATLWGVQGSSHYNTSGVFSVQPGGPLIGLAKGADWGHNQAGHFYLFNKHTGLKTLAEKIDTPKNHEGLELRPFQVGGVLLTDNRLFLIGPGEDRDGDKKLGAKRPEGLIPRVDQGLAVWAYDLTLADLQPNDGATGPATLDTVRLKLAFAHSQPSPFASDDTLESHGQSWYETDGFFRPKPMIADGDGVWLSWKPSAAAPVQLIYADASGLTPVDLDIGQGMKGVDLWPKLQLALTAAGRRLVYATGTSVWRERVLPADIDAFMADFPINRNGTVLFRDAPEKDQQSVRARIQAGGAWAAEVSPPRGDAALAVVDPDTRKLLWTDNLTRRFPALPANEFWTYIDRSHLVVSGEHAHFGFVDNTGSESTLVIARYDLKTSAAPEPRVTRYPLGFPSADYAGSALNDLQIHEGRLYALVTQGRVFTLRDPRWQAQHVLALD
jgi:hypothetical protein